LFQMDQRRQLIILAFVAVILFGFGYRYALWHAARAEEGKPAVEKAETGVAAVQNTQEIVVHISGAVEKPGIYSFARGSRVNDAVIRAGVSAEADLNALNLAALLTDQQKISVPFKQIISEEGNAEGNGPAISGTGATPASSSSGSGNNFAGKSNTFAKSGGGLININTASQAELETLPGIGPALAQRIIQYREKNGNFLTIEDIKNVSGIGEKRFEQLKDQITV
jgi:competence protein ComEA